ncbi:DUF3127 domain-containing protein [bacterium]|nr:MAG: DUF3127 domain-containing protein [bacterium]
MTIKGTVEEIFDTQVITDTFQKREFVLKYEENPQYPEYLKIEVSNDKCQLLNSIKVGQTIEAHVNLRGRAWTDKEGKKRYFNSIQAWKIDFSGSVAQPQSEPVNDDDDDLPF